MPVSGMDWYLVKCLVALISVKMRMSQTCHIIKRISDDVNKLKIETIQPLFKRFIVEFEVWSFCTRYFFLDAFRIGNQNFSKGLSVLQAKEVCKILFVP